MAGKWDNFSVVGNKRLVQNLGGNLCSSVALFSLLTLPLSLSFRFGIGALDLEKAKAKLISCFVKQ